MDKQERFKLIEEIQTLIKKKRNILTEEILIQIKGILEYIKPVEYTEENCPHSNQESTHPYGWIRCEDCGKLLTK